MNNTKSISIRLGLSFSIATVIFKNEKKKNPQVSRIQASDLNLNLAKEHLIATYCVLKNTALVRKRHRVNKNKKQKLDFELTSLIYELCDLGKLFGPISRG